MKEKPGKYIWLMCASLFLLSSCAEFSMDDFSGMREGAYGADKDMPDSGGQGEEQEPSPEAGRITAAEWNDLEHWDFWCQLMRQQNDSVVYYQYPLQWGYSTACRVPVQVLCGNQPVPNAALCLKLHDNVLWEARTDNQGLAELWPAVLVGQPVPSLSECCLYLNGEAVPEILHSDSLNVIKISTLSIPSVRRVELAFVVDATGSMSDEMEFLKKDLESVINRVKDNQLEKTTILTSSVFYRDEGDEYVVKHSDFTTQLSETVEYIRKQEADGGGDFPEAVHTALESALTDLQWSDNAYCRIAFLLLDAPPHDEAEIIADVHQSVRAFAAKGIKLIPIAASGIDKSTEFLLRYFSMATRGTYVFLTDDSGIGNSHLVPSVGDYEVELLGDLMVRIITNYTM